MPTLEEQCEAHGAVPDAADNPGLVKDCVALLKSKDTLAGNATLNWAADVAMADWDGITLAGTPFRVTYLKLHRQGLDGSIPKQLGQLTKLTRLNLMRNKLSGSIPPHLGRLANLKRLHLNDNRLDGEIPPQLGKLAKLKILRLEDNGLSGCIPKSIRKLPLGQKALKELPDDLSLAWCE